MLTIKSRIIILMAVCLVFFAVLYVYQEAKGDMVLAVKDSEQTVIFTHFVEQLDRQTAFMQQSALRLAAGATALYEARLALQPRAAHDIVQRFVLDSMRSLPEALGGGLWFEPYAFFHNRRWYGPYAYHDDGNLVYTEEYDTPDYDYHRRDWYTAALPLDWDRASPRGGHVWWSAPYEDRVGAERYMITTSALMYDRLGRIIGVTTTDWGVLGMAGYIRRQTVGEGVETWLVHAPSGRVLLSTARGAHALPILADWNRSPLAALVGTPSPGEKVIRRKIEFDGKTWFSWCGQSRDGFLLVRLVPDEFRLADIRSVNTSGRLLFLGLCLIVFLVVWLGTRQFAAEINRMVAGLEGVTLEKPDTWTGRAWQYEEICRIASALTRMAERIHHLSEERLSLERGLLQMQKMDALGRMSSGVAHDFNNILHVMYSLIEMLKTSCSSRQADMELVLQLESASRRAGDLVREILSWGRQHEVRKEACQLDDVIDEITPLLERLGGPSVIIRRQRGSGLPDVCLDRAQLGQIFMNLFVNARDAMPEGGSVRFASEGFVAESGEKWVRVSVADEGCGIPGEILEKIFEPFYTTKEEGKGTGLGLAMVRDLVAQNGGRISVASEPGRGTVFTLAFPAA